MGLFSRDFAVKKVISDSISSPRVKWIYQLRVLLSPKIRCWSGRASSDLGGARSIHPLFLITHLPVLSHCCCCSGSFNGGHQPRRAALQMRVSSLCTGERNLYHRSLTYNLSNKFHFLHAICQYLSCVWAPMEDGHKGLFCSNPESYFSI